jgi:hypothetical protein
MLTIAFRNDGTGTREVGNYDVTVSVNGLVVDRARVEGHPRAEDWRALARRLLEQEEERR